MLVILRCACIAMVVFTGFAEIVLAKNNNNDFPPQIDAIERGQILEWVSRTISTQYVDPKVAKIMEEQILSHTEQGTNWERVGVIPDIQTSPEKALGAAYNAALETLLKKAGNDQFRARLEWARADFLAGQQSIVLSTELLTEYSGTYGNRVFIVGDDNILLYQPEPGSAFMLTPLGNNLFGVEGFDHRRFRFERDSKGTVYRVTSLDIDGTSIIRTRVKQE